MFFMLVMEALLTSIRSPDATGRVLPGVEVGFGPALRERGMADDTIVYLARVEDVPRLFESIREFEVASGQRLNEDKSVGVLFGEERLRDEPLPAGVKTWVRFGEGAVDKTLGVSVGTEGQVRQQWETMHGSVRSACSEHMARLRTELSASARVSLVRGAYVFIRVRHETLRNAPNPPNTPN